MSIKKYLSTALAAATATVMLATSAHAALVGRDINGVAVAGSSAGAVFLYDTDLNITWLRNASAAAGSRFDDGFSTTDGFMTWANAKNWASTLTVGSYSGWRLPTMIDTGASGCDYSNSGGTDCGYNVLTATSEMAHLFYVSLRNLAFCAPGIVVCLNSTPQTGWGLVNTGNFQNLQPRAYWFGTEYTLPGEAWVFDMPVGLQGKAFTDEFWSAMAVRPGDVLRSTQIPEPGTLALAAAALVGMAVVRRRRVVVGTGI
jgi:PEP-CTERM motif